MHKWILNTHLESVTSFYCHSSQWSLTCNHRVIKQVEQKLNDVADEESTLREWRRFEITVMESEKEPTGGRGLADIIIYVPQNGHSFPNIHLHSWE